jgi:GT2 family glycosyltransferase
MNKILIITVNYRNTEPTSSLVRSIQKCFNNDNIKLCIVDNDTTADSFASLNKIKDTASFQIEIIRSDKNRFYWAGAKLGLDKYFKDIQKFDWIIVCNNDIEFNDDKFFQKLSNLNHDEYQIIAPQIKSTKSQKNLNPFLLNPISRIQDIYYTLYYANALTAKFIHAVGNLLNQKLAHRSLVEGKGVGGSKIKNQKSKNQKIYAPHGSCMIFSNHYFIKGGYLDTGFTMYGEEVSTAEIAKKMNTNIYYIPELSLVHRDHQSTGQSNWKTNYNHSKVTYLYIKKKYRS